MLHLNETETRNGLPTATALFPYQAEVVFLDFWDFLYVLEVQKGVLLF